MADDTQQPEEENPIGAEAIDDNTLPEDFDVQENADGSASIFPKEGEDETAAADADFYENLAENKVTSAECDTLSTEYLEHIETDKKARELRDKQYTEALRRSGLGDDAPGGADFDGASRVVHPLIAEAAVDFSSRAIKELFPSDGAVKSKIEGKVTAKKMQKAERKTRHMNWQLRKQIPEFRPALEQILTQVPMGGVQYSKMYYWDRGQRPRFEFIPLDDVYVPFHAVDFYTASRKTHKQRLNKIQFEERVASGLYVDVELERVDPDTEMESKAEKANDKIEGKEDPQYDEDGLRTVFEIYCWLDLGAADPLAKNEYRYAPYIMTIDNPTKKVLAIYRNWDPELNTFEALDWIVEWAFIPWRGAYAIGLSHLTGGLSAAITGALRALLDSAHINNAATAIKLKGAQFSGQSQTIGITQINEIDAAPGVDDIRKIAMPLPFNPPSTVLMSLLQFLVETGKGVVRTSLDNMPEASPNTPVGTELSRVEQGLVVYSSIHSRLHGSMERTLLILHRLNKQHLVKSVQEVDPTLLSKHADDWDDEISIPLAFKEDYEGEMDVQPVSDPNIFSEHQRFAQMTAVGQLMQQFPQLYDARAYNTRMLQLLKVPNADELMPQPKQMQDENPATENIKLAMGIAASVLPDQDHLAHIQVHTDFMLDPVYGQNPFIMESMAGQWCHHMMQHMLMLYGTEIKTMIEQAAGGKPIKELMGDEPELKEALSKAIAAASPLALKNTQQLLLQKVVPLVTKMSQYAKSLQPPQPQDPTAVQAQAVQAQAQNDAQRNQISQQKNDNDKQIKLLETQTEQQDAELKARVDLVKNQEDNNTAIQIASMRAVEGGSVGNLKNGTGLDQNYNDGGLVE